MKSNNILPNTDQSKETTRANNQHNIQDGLFLACMIFAFLIIGGLVIKSHNAKKTSIKQPAAKIQASRPGAGMKRMEVQCVSCKVTAEAVVPVNTSSIEVDCKMCGGVGTLKSL